jgi:molybdopterin molybdotransferase
LGQVGGTAFVGLPGNPVAVMVTFMVIARSLVQWMSGTDPKPIPRYSVKAGFDHGKKTGRREWVRVRVDPDAQGVLTAYQDHSGGAGILTSMVGADGLLELNEESTGISSGQPVDFLPFKEVLS